MEPGNSSSCPVMLPPELIAQVLSYLVPDGEFPTDKPDLHSCSLVCRAWRDLSVSYMYSSISFSFAGWPIGNGMGEHDRPLSESEKRWMTVSTTGMGGSGPCYLPRHRFAALFNFFRSHPNICQHVRSLQLNGLRYNATPDHDRASVAQWMSRFMGSSPVDKSLFLSTVKLFPRLQRLHVERIVLAEPTPRQRPRVGSQNTPTAHTQRVSLTSLAVDFGRASMFAHHVAGVGRDADLSRIVDCFEGLQELSIGRFIDRAATIFTPTFTPKLRLHGLSIKHSGIMGQSLLDFPHIANLRDLQLDIYMMTLPEIYPWEKIFSMVGPRLENLECRFAVGANWMAETELPYLSACTNLCTLRLCVVPSSDRAWDMPLHMLTSYLTVPEPKLTRMMFAIHDSQFTHPMTSHIQPLLAIGDALLALERKIGGLEIKVLVHTPPWMDFMLNDLEPFHQLSSKGFVGLSEAHSGF